MDLLRDAAHVVHGDMAAGVLAAAGLMRVHADRDMLALGPCDPDPVRHARLRARFWKREHAVGDWSWQSGHAARFVWPRRGPVVLWTSPTLPERLFFWRAVDRLSSLELWRAEAAHPDRLVGGLATLPPEAVQPTLRLATPLSARDVRAARRCWAAFTSGSLDELAKALAAEPSPQKAMLDSLPRLSGGRVRLSVRDELLLKPFRIWRSPLQGLAGMRRAGDRAKLRELLVFGDLFVLNRLWNWSLLAAPALFARRLGNAHPWRDVDLILTPFGRRALHALTSPAEAPPFRMGGHEVYGPRTWMVTNAGALVRAP